MRQKQTGFRRLGGAIANSVAGLRCALRTETAFRQECAVAIILLPLAFWLGQTAAQRALLIASCLLVLVIELVNSGIEAAVDRTGTDFDPLAGRAKDLGSAAVFVSIGLTVLVWGLIGWERFGQ